MAALQGCACEAMEVNSGGLTFEGLQLGKSCQNNSLLYVSSQSKTYSSVSYPDHHKVFAVLFTRTTVNVLVI